MISGSLWNAVAICEMTKTSWQTGNLKMNEDLGNLSRTCFVRGWNLRRRYSDCWDGRIEKFDASEIYPRRLNAKEVLITQKDRESIFPVADGSAKLSKKKKKETTNSKNPLWDGNPPLGERSSAENLTSIGKSFDLKNRKMTQKIGNNFGLFKDTSFIVIILNREFNLRAQRRIIPYFQDVYYWTKLLREEIYDAGGELEKSQNFSGQTQSIM